MLIHSIYHPVENPDSLILLSWLSVTENMEIGYCNQFFDHPEFRVLLYLFRKREIVFDMLPGPDSHGNESLVALKG